MSAQVAARNTPLIGAGVNLYMNSQIMSASIPASVDPKGTFSSLAKKTRLVTAMTSSGIFSSKTNEPRYQGRVALYNVLPGSVLVRVHLPCVHLDRSHGIFP